MAGHALPSPHGSRVVLTRDALDIAALTEAFHRDRSHVGAVVIFTGLARSTTDGVAAGQLTLDAYPGFTEKVMVEMADEARSRFDIDDVSVWHRWGEIPVGEAIVFVAVAAVHRRPAFEAADFLMDHLKTRAPFWKREDGPGGRRWIEPRPHDLADLTRWSQEPS